MTSLTVHRSERADPLVDALAGMLRLPAADPFAPELVAVPSRGVERWLAQRLSHVLGAVDGDGVCANVAFPASSTVLDDAVAAADETYERAQWRWSAGRAVWALLPIIDDAARTPSRASVLAAHLAAGDGRRFTVASKLARLFERYGRSRPAMVRAWAAGLDEDGNGARLPEDLTWQAGLWRDLRATLGSSPGELHAAACERLRSDPGAVDLPERLSVFGITRLSLSRVATMHALAAGRDLHLWLHHPSPALWRAVASVRPTPGPRRTDALARRVTNPLLASLSRDIRELQVLLDGPDVRDDHIAVAPRPDTLLGRVQGDLAADTVTAPPGPIAPDDHSLTVHACHGPARQVEVIREVVLGLLRDDPTLQPRDVLVMCPNVETFAPLIAASFGMTDETDGHPAATLRVRLADRSLQQTNPLLGLLAQLLQLGSERITASQLLDLAQIEPVRARFGLGDDDLETLRARVLAANARWGLDAAHRAPYGLAALGQGTWRAALDRMLLGVTMEESDSWIGDVVPLDDVDSGAIDLVGRFAELVDRVDGLVRAMERPRSVGEWTSLLAEAVAALGAPARAWQAVQLRSELEDIAEAASDTDVQLARADFAALVEAQLSGRPTRASFRTGTLTVCTLVPMRSVPHRVVCLIGMDDGAFPRHGVVDGDDVLARDPVTGERDVRSEDRQLFLDAIFAARENLVITYTGADPRSGVEVPPCVPLGELLDALDLMAVAPHGERAREHVVVRHPLQTFDERNFVPGALGTAASFSFDPSGLAGARAASCERHAPAPLLTRPLPPLAAEPVDLDELVAFVTAPMRRFLEHRLHIGLWQDASEPADALPLDMVGLPAWVIGDRLLRQRLGGTSLEVCRGLELRRGNLPPGRIGERLLDQLIDTVEALLVACRDVRTRPPRSLDIAVALDGGRELTGTVGGLYDRTLLEVSYSSLGPKPKLQSWLRYLAVLVQTGDMGLQALTIGRANGGARRSTYRGIDPREARALLADLVQLRDAGLRAPLPLALKTSERYAAQILDDRGEDAARYAAGRRWSQDEFGSENEESAHVIVLGEAASLDALVDFAPDDDATLRFAPLALRLWRPIHGAERS